MQRDSEPELIEDWRRGTLAAAQELVRIRQSETLTIAYLLTGDRDRARGLALAAFLNLLRSARSLDPESDPRLALLIEIGRTFLRGEYEPHPVATSRLVTDSRPQKYGVENQRERTLAALGRLEERERVALILGEIAGFEPGDLNQVLQRGNTILTAPVETARQRLRHSLDIPTSEPVRPALLEAAFDGPRDDLWPELEELVSEIQRHQQRQAQILTYGVIGGVALVAIVLLVTIFADGLIGADDPLVAVADVPAIEDEIEPGNPAVIPPTPTPGPTPIPVGNVPALVLSPVRHNPNSMDAYTELTLYNREDNTLEAIPGGDSVDRGSLSESPLITPDGDRLLMLFADGLQEDVHYQVAAFDTQTLEPQWQTEIGTYPNHEFYGHSVRIDLALTSDRVYVATLNLETPDEAMLVGFDLDDGVQREMTTISIDPISFTPNFNGNIFLHVPADESRLIMALESFTPAGHHQLYLHSIYLPNIATSPRAVSQVQTMGQNVGFGGAKITPDGGAIYTLSSTQNRWPARLEFFELDSGEITTIRLPFSDDYQIAYPTLISSLSHDGQTLHIIDRMTGDVAIVNLSERRIERFFPIDTGDIDPNFGIGPGQYVFGWPHALAQDGETLYIAAGIGDQTQMQTSPADGGIWAIDLREWRIVDFRPVQGELHDIYVEPDGQFILANNRYFDRNEGRTHDRMVRIDLAGNDTQPEPIELLEAGDRTSNSLLPLASLYRSQHGRTPTVDGIRASQPDAFSTLPRVEVAPTFFAASGAPTAIEVAIFNPVSGEVLKPGAEGVRFDPDSTVAAVLNAEDQQAQVIVMANVDSGIYRGSVTLPAAGSWTIDVVMTAPDGSATISPAVGSVEVAPTFTGSNGRQYYFSVTTSPTQPETNEEIAIQMRLVDAESGTPMPSGVELVTGDPALDGISFDDLPERVSVGLYHQSDYGAGGSRTALLYDTSPGIYKGLVTLWTDGSWEATIHLQRPDQPRVSIYGGIVQVIGAS